MSQNDRDNIAKAKDECYKKGFHEGIMNVGKYKGERVSKASPLPA